MKPEQWGQDPKSRSGLVGCLLSLAALVVLVLVLVVLNRQNLSWLTVLGVMGGLIVAGGIVLRTWWWPAVASAPIFLMAFWVSALVGDLFWHGSWGELALVAAEAIGIAAAGGLGVVIGKRRRRRQALKNNDNKR